MAGLSAGRCLSTSTTSTLASTMPQCNSFAFRKAVPSFLLASTQRGFLQHRFSTTRRNGWRVRMVVVTGALNTSATPPDPPQGASSSSSLEGLSGGLGSTRLGKAIAVRRRQLLQRFNAVRRHFPTKIFLLLLGFFSANALATILGQTGDWDVIAAGVLVALIEGVGQVMYNTRSLLPAFLGTRGKSVVEMVNFWKIGFTFALFVDAFKVGS